MTGAFAFFVSFGRSSSTLCSSASEVVRAVNGDVDGVVVEDVVGLAVGVADVNVVVGDL